MMGLTVVDMALLVGFSMCICIMTTALAVESAALFLPAFLIVFPVLLPSFPTILMNEAIGLTLVIMFFGQTSALVGYLYRGQVLRNVAKRILTITVPIAVLGRVLAYFVSESVLLLVFTILLLALSVVVFRSYRATDWHVPMGGTGPQMADGSGVSEKGSIDVTFRDAIVLAAGGVVGGLTGFATGEVTNTRLHVTKKMPIKLSTGTSTLVLYVTLVAANLVNLAILQLGAFGADGTVSPPWGVAVVIAPIVLVGGQVGSYLNNRLSERRTTKLLLGMYVLVSIVTVSRMV